MHVEQGIASITVERKIIRANGTEERNEVVAYWHRDPEIMAAVLGSPGVLIDGDQITPKNPRGLGPVTPSETLLRMTREQLEGGSQ